VAAFVNPTIDAGFVPLVAVGDFTWIDVDRDGVQDPDEPVLPGVTVELFDADGQPVVGADGEPVPPVVTDANGFYLFDGLLPGDYMIRFTPPAGFEFTSQYSGGSEDDSDAWPEDGWTGVFTIDPGVAGDTVSDTDPGTVAAFVNPTIDAGFVPLVAVGDFVWLDADGDGIQDPDESPFPGVVLELRDMAGNPVVDIDGNPVGPQTTNSEGRYLFERLAPGQYTVLITYPAGFGPTREGVGDGASDSSSFLATSRVLVTGADLTLDFGVVPVTRTLPATGDRSVTQSAWAIALLLLGLGFVVGARRRTPGRVIRPG
jgi:LPXTG-motif cell wall-anchored protein